MRSPTKNNHVGIHIGNFRIAQKLGQSSTGEIYEAIQDAIGYRAAAKFFPGTLNGDAEQNQYAKRFRDEAQAVNFINHPAVVKVFDFGEVANGLIYILMEYVDGPSLRTIIEEIKAGKRPRFTNAAVMQIMQQIASVMASAHAKSVVHRDLKPENIVLEQNSYMPGGQRVRVLDFGLARFLDSPERRTSAGLAVGTPAYMSPEQCYGKSLDGKADVYSLGCLIYELLVGELPFTETDAAKLMMEQINAPPPPLAPRLPGLPPAVEQLVMSMLAKQPAARPDMLTVSGRIDELERSGLFRTATASDGKGAATAPGKQSLAWVAAAVLGLLAGGAAGLLASRTLAATECPPASAQPTPSASAHEAR